MRGHLIALGGLLSLLVLGITLTARAQVVSTLPKRQTLEERLVKETKVKKTDVAKILKALGPALREQLQQDGKIDVPGLGIIRVLRITEYKDLVNGLPTTIPARNYVEIEADSAANRAVNQPGVPPARTIQGYEFRVNPNASPGIKTQDRRVPRTRTR